jgi:hypothetical protein
MFRHAGLRVLAEHAGPPPDAPLAVCVVSELYLDTYVNVFGTDTLLAEKPNDDSLVVFHPLNEKS